MPRREQKVLLRFLNRQKDRGVWLLNLSPPSQGLVLVVWGWDKRTEIPS